MMNYVLMDFGHYLGLAGLFAGLTMELVLFAPRVDGATARKLAVADIVYGLAALLVLVTGLLRLFAGDKPAAYFGHNFVFHIKVTLFVVVALLSIWPTTKFFRGRKAATGSEVEYPAAVGVLLKVEFALLLIIPLLAVMMSRGYGFNG